MAKIMTISGLVASALIVFIFLLDLALEVPFRRASVIMDVIFIICGVIVAFFSWTTMKEQT
jgi:hypothetical protein